MTVTDQLDADVRSVLETYGFDESAFLDLQARVRAGTLTPDSAVVTGTIEPPAPEDVVHLPLPGEPGHDEAHAAGLEVLRAGAVASVVLNGGMATRFGGVVKGVVEAYGGKSFLELKLEQAAELSEAIGAPVPTAVMTSFATDAATREFLAGRGVPAPLYFHQYVSLRLERDGELFRTQDGRPSLYAPGHGDFLVAFRQSGTLAALRERGVRYVMVSNVDNLPARIEPAVIGTHVTSGRPLSIEVVANTGDVGGAPVRLDGHPMILETMRFPAGFDHSTLPVVNVNTATFDLEALDRDFDLTWIAVQKTVEDRKAVQLERLYHEASVSLPTTFLEVPAEGPHGRFLPIKKPDDLVTAQASLGELLGRGPLD